MQKLTEDRHTDKRKTHNLLIHNLFWSSTIRAKNEIYMDVPQPSTMMKKALYGPLEYANPELNMEAPYIIRLWKMFYALNEYVENLFIYSFI